MLGVTQRFLVGLLLAAALPASVLQAEDQGKVLPTLLIKGEVVSVDTADPAAVLIKVKDRYGFETPIFLQSATAITQGETPRSAADLSAGAPVEVEYNFDVNTAKRHAVSVKLTAPTAEAAAPAIAMEAPLESAPAAVEPPAEASELEASGEALPMSDEAAPSTP